MASSSRMPDNSLKSNRVFLTNLLGRSWFVRYALAVLLVSLAWAARAALTPLWGPTAVPFIFFYPAIVIAGWYGRRGPALLAIALSTLTANWFFIEPRHSFALHHPSEAVALAVFVIVNLILAGAIDLMHGARDRLANELAQRLKAEAQLAAEKELLATTLTSIGDAVIVTDEKGTVVSLNSEAERLTSWRRQEAFGKPLAEVFQIVNEQTRRTVENPVEKVLRLGTVTGLANHTVVISKDGRETPIDDSAAPIRHENGPILGVVLVFRDVTEQRRAHQERERLAAVVQYSDAAIFTKDVNGIIDTWNESAARLFGYEAAEIVGQPVTKLIPPELFDEEEEIVERLKRGESSEWLETVRVTKVGRRIPVLLTTSPLKNAHGEIIGASKIVRDISDLVKARADLMREKELLATTLTSIGDAVIVTDDEGRVTFLNKEAERLTSWSSDEASGRQLSEVFHIINEQTREPVENPVEKVIRIGGVVGLANHTVLIAKDGREIPIDDSAAPIRQPGGPLFGVVLVFRDFTERKLAEQALRDREERFRTMANNAPVLIWVSGTDKLCNWFNRQWLEFTGRTMEQELGNGWAEGVHKDDFDLCLKTYVESFDARQPFTMEYRLRRHDGEWRWVLDNGTPTYEANDVFTGYIGSCLDVTDRKLAEVAVSESQARLAGLIDAAMDAVIAVDADQRIVLFNPAAEQMFACAAADVVGTSLDRFIPISARDNHRQHIENFGTTGATSRRMGALGSLRGVRGNGEEFPIEASISHLNLAGEKLFTVILRDITERKLAETERERLLKTEQELRVAAEEANRLKDEFLAIMSHELRNPLNVILGYSELLVRTDEVAQLPQLHRMAEAIKRNAVSQSKLIRDLLDLSRLRSGKLELNKEIVPFMMAVGNAIDTVRSDANAKRITIDVTGSKDALFVEADPVRLEQIVWNVLNNSVKFTPVGGRISVRAVKDGDQISLSVDDTGQGIDSSFLPHVFEMFRQADGGVARAQSGMGVGLAVVQQLVDLHQGTVTASSEGAGKGARFTITLPLSSEPEAKSPVVLDLTTTLNQLMVLVVDDSEDTTEMLAQLLKISGATVTGATSGHDALQLMAQHEFDVVLSDISMPGMDGFEFLRRLRELPTHEDVPVLALTGFGRPEDVERAQAAGFYSHVTKPFELEALMTVLQKLPKKRRDGGGAKRN
jgi:PAS domain S-box-containing protein